MILLKIKMFLHMFIGFTSVGISLVMMLEAKCNVYPDFFCWVCAVTSFINAAYSAYLCCKCEDEMKKERK